MKRHEATQNGTKQNKCTTRQEERERRRGKRGKEGKGVKGMKNTEMGSKMHDKRGVCFSHLLFCGAQSREPKDVTTRPIMALQCRQLPSLARIGLSSYPCASPRDSKHHIKPPTSVTYAPPSPPTGPQSRIVYIVYRTSHKGMAASRLHDSRRHHPKLKNDAVLGCTPAVKVVTHRLFRGGHVDPEVKSVLGSAQGMASTAHQQLSARPDRDGENLVLPSVQFTSTHPRFR